MMLPSIQAGAQHSFARSWTVIIHHAPSGYQRRVNLRGGDYGSPAAWYLADSRRMSESHHRSCKYGAVYDRSEHIAEAREISSFECAVCGATIENWSSAWFPRYRFIACPSGMPKDKLSQTS